MKKMKNVLVMPLAALLVTTLVASGCTQQEGAATVPQADTVSREVYEAKITYYEAYLQTLGEQISQMDQQLYVMQAEYKNRTDALEQALQQLREAGEASGDRAEPPVPELMGGGQTKEEDISGSMAEASTDITNNEAQSTGSALQEQTTPQKQSSEYQYSEMEGGIMLTKYIGNSEHVSVPAAIDGKRVLALADSVFAQTSVRSVYLPETVGELGWFCFYGCEQLTSVSLPASIRRIGYASFDGCSKDLCLIVTKNSYAHQYAASFALRCMTLE